MTNQPYVMAALAVWSGWGLSWVAAAMWTGRRTASALPRSFRPLLAIAFLGFLLLFGESPRVRHPLWLVPSAVGWALVVLVGLACALAWWARVHLGALWSAGIVTREGHRVVDSGPYAYVRHPIYTALISGAGAYAGVKATPAALAGAALIALAFALKARVEESFLAAELGEAAYAAYRRRVPMLIPFLTIGR